MNERFLDKLEMTVALEAEAGDEETPVQQASANVLHVDVEDRPQSDGRVVTASNVSAERG